VLIALPQWLHSLPLMIALALLFLVLNILDGHSTWQVIRPHHFRRERNPVARWAFRKLGLPHGIFLFKAMVFAIVIPAGGWYAAHDVGTLSVLLIAADLLFGFVVWHNYRLARRMRSWRKIPPLEPFWHENEHQPR
jgi:hypothetical protein